MATEFSRFSGRTFMVYNRSIGDKALIFHCFFGKSRKMSDQGKQPDLTESEESAGTAVAPPEAAQQRQPATAKNPPSPLPPWKVLLHNDENNEMLFVIRAIVELTPLNREDALTPDARSPQERRSASPGHPQRTGRALSGPVPVKRPDHDDRTSELTNSFTHKESLFAARNKSYARLRLERRQKIAQRLL